MMDQETKEYLCSLLELYLGHVPTDREELLENVLNNNCLLVVSDLCEALNIYKNKEEE